MNYFRNRSRTPTKTTPKKDEGMSKSASTNQLVYQKTLRLPDNFADDLLQYEMELEKKVITIEIINKILELYSTAIEYYESNNDDRYLIFKNKMNALWLRPNVLEALNQQEGQFYSNTHVLPTTPKRKTMTDQLNIKAAQRQKALDIQFQYELMRNKTSSPKIFMQKHDKLQTERAQVIQKENTSQRVQLLQRIKSRQQSVSPIKHSPDCSTPKFKKKTQSNFLQKQVEEIEKQRENERQALLEKLNEKADSQLKLLQVQVKEGRNNELIYKLMEKIKKEREQEAVQIEKDTAQKYQSLIEHLQ